MSGFTDFDEEFLISFLGEKKYHPSMEYPAPGVRFFSEVRRCSIIRTEIDEPSRDMELYDLYDVDIRPMDVSSIPAAAYPYPNCLFVSRLAVKNEGCGLYERVKLISLSYLHVTYVARPGLHGFSNHTTMIFPK